MPKNSFSHVRHWVFDLDNTLYPPEARLFDQIEVKMTRYVMESIGVDRARADHLRQQYWRTYGTTLAGLMREHDVDPTPYLNEVHEISLAHLQPDPALASHIRALPGRKIIYTNGTAPYAARVAEARGLAGVFDEIYGVENAEFIPKPERRAYDTIFAKAGVVPREAAMFEDEARNLAAPHAMGVACVHVAPERQEAEHIHHHTDDLTHFLWRLVA